MKTTSITEKALEAIKEKRTGATGVEMIREIPNFQEGSLIVVGFTDPEEGKLNNWVYIHDGEVDIFNYDYELLQAVSNPRQPIVNYFLKIGGIAGVIAVMLTITICIIAYKGGVIPELLGNALTVILGFYFGTQIKQQ